MSENIKVVYCYFDETGLLNSPRDAFFAVGMIKLFRPEEIYLPMKSLRDKQQFYDEIKWSAIYHKNAPILREFINLFFDYGKAQFSCYIFKKNDLNLRKHFKGDLFEAYQAFASMQLSSNIAKDEHAIVLMDDMSTPLSVKFEKNIKGRVNRSQSRQAVLGATRVYSKGVELIQLADLLLGGVVYDLKIENNRIKSPGEHKRDTLKLLKKRSGVKTFTCDVSTNQLNIWHFKTK